MRRHRTIPRLLAPLLALGLLTGAAGAQQYPGEEAATPGYDGQIQARIWFDRGDEPILDRGERVRIYYRASQDAYVAVFNIDTNGTVRMVYPRSPEENNWARGGRDYRLLFPRSPYWYVDDEPGLGYYFVVASARPFDFSTFDFSYYGQSWDLTRVGRHVYRDPYVAMDDYVAALLPDWEQASYGLDFSTYHVGRERYDYPRFMCYDCHGFRSYESWNPYHYHCTQFRVVIYDDPWYYPSHRYSGTRVVYANIPRVRLPRFDFKERVEDEAAPPLIVERATSGSRPGVAAPAPRRSPAGVGPGGEEPAADRRARPRTTAPESGGRPGLPSDATSPRRGGSAGAASPEVGRGGTGAETPSAARPTPTRRSPPKVGSGESAPAERRFVPVLGPRTGGESRPTTGERSRPVLERRPAPPSGGSSGGATGGSEPRERPSAVARPPASGGTPRGGTPSTGTVRRGTGGSGGTARPSGGGGNAGRPPVVVRPPSRPSTGAGAPASPRTPPVVRRRGGGESSGSARPSVGTRSGGAAPTRGAPTAPPRVKPRSGGGSGSAAPARARGGGTPARPAPTRVRPRGGGSSGGGARPSARPRGSSGGSAPATRPAPPRRGGGGGG